MCYRWQAITDEFSRGICAGSVTIQHGVCPEIPKLILSARRATVTARTGFERREDDVTTALFYVRRRVKADVVIAEKNRTRDRTTFV